MLPGEPGNTLFPANWSADQIMHAISDVATDPGIPWTQETGVLGTMFTKAGGPARFSAVGFRGGVWIKAIVEPMGEGIITGFPLP